jgi:molybdate transport system substrate-binding protein
MNSNLVERSKLTLGSVLAATFLFAAALQCFSAEVRVFAAASLTDALRLIAADYQKHSGDKIVLNLGASSALARQIEAGAPADIFFSADEASMERLQTKGLLVNESRRSRLSNVLVGVVAAEQGAPVSSPKDLANPEIKRVALGDPRAVPIGVYARQYLERLNLWDRVSPKIVPTENVRAALAAVEAGNADASIVYKTDAAISSKVKVVFEVPQAEGPQITYPMAITKGTHDPKAAEKLLAYLCSNDAAKVFRECGFVVLEPAPKP